MSTVTYGSLFSGIEGIGLGLEHAGMQPMWRCEIDPDCRKVLNRHWPDIPCYPDVKEIDDRTPRVDVLCGGFPCQDVSVAGRRAGLAGARSGLFHEFMRIAAALTPRWVLIENVPGLLSSNDGADMATVLGAVADVGYGWAYRVLDAQHFGVPQRRRRVFIVGCLGNPVCAAQILFEPESCDGDPPKGKGPGQRTAGTLTSCAGGGGLGGVGQSASAITSRIVEHPGSGEGIVNALTATGVGTCGADDNQGQAGHLLAVFDPAPTLTARYGKGAGSDCDDALVLSDPTPSPIAFHQTQEPITAYDLSPCIGATSIGKGVAVTDSTPLPIAFNPHRTLNKDGSITSGFGARPVVDALHGPTGNNQRLLVAGWAVRRLTPTECERLQGFPDGHTAGLSDSVRYRTLGNAVAVPVAEWIGRRIMAHTA